MLFSLTGCMESTKPIEVQLREKFHKPFQEIIYIYPFEDHKFVFFGGEEMYVSLFTSNQYNLSTGPVNSNSKEDITTGYIYFSKEEIPLFYGTIQNPDIESIMIKNDDIQEKATIIELDDSSKRIWLNIPEKPVNYTVKIIGKDSGGKVLYKERD